MHADSAPEASPLCRRERASLSLRIKAADIESTYDRLGRPVTLRICAHRHCLAKLRDGCEVANARKLNRADRRQQFFSKCNGIPQFSSLCRRKSLCKIGGWNFPRHARATIIPESRYAYPCSFPRTAYRRRQSEINPRRNINVSAVDSPYGWGQGGGAPAEQAASKRRCSTIRGIALFWHARGGAWGVRCGARAAGTCGANQPGCARGVDESG